MPAVAETLWCPQRPRRRRHMSVTQAPESLSIQAPHSFFIGGKWVEPSTSAKLSITSPVTEAEIFTFAEAVEDDIDRAVAAARAAFDDGPWPTLSAAERAEALRSVARAL